MAIASPPSKNVCLLRVPSPWSVRLCLEPTTGDDWLGCPSRPGRLGLAWVALKAQGRPLGPPVLSRWGVSLGVVSVGPFGPSRRRPGYVVSLSGLLSQCFNSGTFSVSRPMWEVEETVAGTFFASGGRPQGASHVSPNRDSHVSTQPQGGGGYCPPTAPGGFRIEVMAHLLFRLYIFLHCPMEDLPSLWGPKLMDSVRAHFGPSR